jgi:hypothetical protein
VLILATERKLYTVLLAEAVERELQRNVAYTLPPSVPPEARDVAAEEVRPCESPGQPAWPQDSIS